MNLRNQSAKSNGDTFFIAHAYLLISLLLVYHRQPYALLQLDCTYCFAGVGKGQQTAGEVGMTGRAGVAVPAAGSDFFTAVWRVIGSIGRQKIVQFVVLDEAERSSGATWSFIKGTGLGEDGGS